MTTTVSSILKFLENADKNFAMDTDSDIPKTKKRKLDHLTWEEKLQRKKLKNRVAAQTSRDRKKAKMEQMEQALQQLFVKNESLLVECKNLKLANQKLQQENTELYNRLQAPCLSCAQAQNRSVGCESLNGSTASLLLPKGRVTHPAAALSKQQTMVLLKIVLTCLLYRTSLMNSRQTSTLTRWNNSLRASLKISPETWKLLLRKQVMKNQEVMEVAMEKWWGRHQQSWNPVGAQPIRSR